jgi:hypothetical protein
MSRPPQRNRRWKPWGLCLGAGFIACALAAASQEPPPAPAPELSQELSIEVRAADIGDLLGRLSATFHVALDAEPEIRGERVTLRAGHTTVGGVQRALAALLHSRWAALPEGDRTRYRLENNTALQAQAARLRAQRRVAFVARVLETETALRRRDPDGVAASVRAGVAAREPALPPSALEEITPDFLAQTLLFTPVRLGIGPALTSTGAAWTPFARLPAAHRQLLADFYSQQVGPSDGSTGESVAELVLSQPSARLEYRFMHGDRWTGTMLMARAGVSDHWATALLPGMLYDLPDYGTLYPEARAPADDADLRRPVNLAVDTGAVDWDQALAAVARAAQINVISDSYLRPTVFQPAGAGAPVGGATLGEVLDRLAEHYGYVWWKDGDFYLFRNRMWAEEGRVAVPQRLLTALGRGLAASDRLPSPTLAALGGLTDEQVLTLQMYGSAGGRPYAPAESFDLNEAQLLQSCLVLFAQLDEPQREMARETGVPFAVMNASQQALFAGLAADRGFALTPYEQDQGRFRVSDQFHRERLPAGWAEVGTVRFTLGFGAAGGGGERTAQLAIRAPAAEPPPGQLPVPPPAQGKDGPP